MKIHLSAPPVTICVLIFGNYPHLARQCLDSIERHCDRSLYRLVVGANAPGEETAEYLKNAKKKGLITRLILSPVNLWKSPMMRRMFEGVDTEYIWWFDDDSYITSMAALPERLKIARQADPPTVMWGQVYWCDHPAGFWNGDPVKFVRTAAWYRRLTPPFWEPGGKGELNFNKQGTGDGRWFFLVGGGWFARTQALKELNWPDERLLLLGDDVFLGEAVRQQGWKIQDIGEAGVHINTAPRRWTLEGQYPPPTTQAAPNVAQPEKRTALL